MKKREFPIYPVKEMKLLRKINKKKKD